MVRDIVFVVYPGFQMLDLAGPLAAFEVASFSAECGYRLHTVSSSGGPVRSSSGLLVSTTVLDTSPCDTMIIVGGGAPGIPFEATSGLSTTLKRSLPFARRLASVCTGAFILAATGELDGKQATTHWRYALQLQRTFPRVRVESERIYIKDENIWTSAGVSAGIDLALALIEEDLGAALSRAVAQTLVVYHRRPGGQSQFSALLDLQPESDRIRTVLSYMRENLSRRLSIEDLADVACLSPRQFGRTFLAETGQTPAKAVERLRAEVAREKVERGGEPIETIARSVGFSDPERMRRAFLRLFGHPPQSVRRLAVNDLTPLVQLAN